MNHRKRLTTTRSHTLRFEPLERRELLSVVPMGPELQVHTYTTNHQEVPSTAMDAVGNYVVVWRGEGAGDATGIFAQRFNAAGAPQGTEFRVNTYTTGSQLEPSVAMDADGDFVVAWNSFGQDGNGYGIFAKRFNAAGVAQGTEFGVPTSTFGAQSNPDVAIDADGNFVVAWTSNGVDGNQAGISAQRFSAAGVAQGGELVVNTYALNSQRVPTIAMDVDGDFVIAWESGGQDGSQAGIFAQRFDAAGVAQGSELPVNTYTTNNQRAASAAMDADGDFVIAWQSLGPDGGSYGIYGQRYNASGVPQGSEFVVNTYTTSPQQFPSVAMDSVGNFVVAWESLDQDGDLDGVYLQRFSSAGLAQGSELVVNTYTTGDQRLPALAMDAGGDFVIAWSSAGQDGSGNGIYSQRFGLLGDFDDDGDCDSADIDILWHITRGTGSDPNGDDSADLDGNTFANEDDVDYLLAHLVTAGTNRKYGDADIDGDVDGADFDLWRTRPGYTGAGTGDWSIGDFDGDGDVDGADFDLWRTRPTTYPTTVGPHADGLSGALVLTGDPISSQPTTTAPDSDPSSFTPHLPTPNSALCTPRSALPHPETSPSGLRLKFTGHGGPSDSALNSPMLRSRHLRRAPTEPVDDMLAAWQ